ncbi:MAG: hypothetical protein QF554_00440 [Dehalococcoidia bacterium]|nr:hypothetical protein [Dehalococcoidia bacterium]
MARIQTAAGVDRYPLPIYVRRAQYRLRRPGDTGCVSDAILSAAATALKRNIHSRRNTHNEAHTYTEAKYPH